jgi:hypothetical protein
MAILVRHVALALSSIDSNRRCEEQLGQATSLIQLTGMGTPALSELIL